MNLEEILNLLNILPENFDVYLDDKSIEDLINGKVDDLSIRINDKESRVIESVVWL